MLTQRETIAFISVASRVTIAEQVPIPGTGAARCFDCSFEAGKPMGLSCHSVLLQLSNGLRLWAAQVETSQHRDVLRGDILGVFNGTTIIQPGRTSQAAFEEAYTSKIRNALEIPKTARFFRFAEGKVQLGYPINVGQQRRILWQSVAIVLSPEEVTILSTYLINTPSEHLISTIYRPTL